MKINQEHKKLFQNPKEFFLLLLEKCSEKQVYSVKELAASMNVQYEEIQKLAASDESLSAILELCQEFCLSKTMEDGLYRKLKFKETLKYMAENDDDFKIPEGFKEVEDDDDLLERTDVNDAIFEF